MGEVGGVNGLARIFRRLISTSTIAGASVRSSSAFLSFLSSSSLPLFRPGALACPDMALLAARERVEVEVGQF